MDTVTRERRSEIMSRIRSRDTGPEIAVASALRRAGATGWRRCVRVGKIARPDFVWRREKIALFVDGCFFHRCPECYRCPKTNRTFWRAKVRGNLNRDRRQTLALRLAGWLVLRVYECQVKARAEAEWFARVLARMALPPRRSANVTA